MAIYYPTLEEICNSEMEKPTPGEMFLLNQLSKLDDSFIISFQAHINLLHPDIVILNKKGGVLVIEVKDWNLGAYNYTEDGSLFGSWTTDGVAICGPFEQVNGYKDEYINVLNSFYKGKLGNRKVYGVIKTSVFFYNSTEREVEQRLCVKNNEYKNFYHCWTRDTYDICGKVKELLRKNSYFTDEMFMELNSLLIPSKEICEQSHPITLSKSQLRWSESEEGDKAKIKGVAGSGKTLVLSVRAANCYRRTKKPVLVLTFNITLPNYIRDKIAQQNRDLLAKDRAYIHIDYIHHFVKAAMRTNNIKCPKKHYNSAEAMLLDYLKVLKENRRFIKSKYAAILIDEVQDYKYEWLKDIEELFLEENGEFVLFGDEKQNIYDRTLDDDKLPRTTIRGRWGELKESFRLSKKNYELALKFQEEFLQNKYKTDLNDKELSCCNDKEGYFEIIEITNDTYESGLANEIKKIRNKKNIAINDICIVSGDCEKLRELESQLKNQLGYKVQTTCESKEEYDKIYSMCSAEGDFKEKIYNIRRNKKKAFNMNSGLIKLSTIHSFKGWEIDTLVVILHGNDSNDTDELIYTAITRSKNNLFIINCGNEKYKEFFESNK